MLNKLWIVNIIKQEKKYKKYGYCTKYKKEVSLFCKDCEKIEYKEYKSIKKRTTKKAKAEKDH